MPPNPNENPAIQGVAIYRLYVYKTISYRNDKHFAVITHIILRKFAENNSFFALYNTLADSSAFLYEYTIITFRHYHMVAVNVNNEFNQNI